MADPIQQDNIAETIAREVRKPFAVPADHDFIAVPEGWKLEDTERLEPVPRRKVSNVSLADEAGFVDYLKRHGSLASCTIWCDADYPSGRMGYTAILNDHKESADGQQWRDHIAKFAPEKSVEWSRWVGKNKAQMSQLEFAEFIENNLSDIASADGYPTGTAMLQMATSLEIAQDSRIKSAIRLQSGGVRMEYVEDDTAETVKSMEVFSRFALGLPVFRGCDAYQLEARLKYRLASGKLSFWYELQRHDKVLEAAAQTITASIQQKAGFPIYHGNPFNK